MKIQRATASHLESLVPLFDGYRTFYKQPSDLQVARTFLQGHFDRKSSVIFLATDDREDKGLGFTQLYPLYSSVSARHTWVLNDLYVSPDARRQGVAKGLMDEARTFAKEDGALQLLLETASDNKDAQALYEKLGWVKEEGIFHYTLALN